MENLKALHTQSSSPQVFSPNYTSAHDSVGVYILFLTDIYLTLLSFLLGQSLVISNYSQHSSSKHTVVISLVSGLQCTEGAKYALHIH